nr:hypothetical protein [Streptococcus gallolyticus]
MKKKSYFGISTVWQFFILKANPKHTMPQIFQIRSTIAMVILRFIR